MKRAAVLAVALASSFALAPSAPAVTGVPPGGLPPAVDYSSSVLPDLAGVVSWKTLAQVTPVAKNGKMIAEFSKDILGLDRKNVRVQGFIIPLDMGEKQSRFLLSSVPPHCQFCLPAGPDGVVEVRAIKPIQYGFEPIVVSGRFAVLKDDEAGLLYRLTDAEEVAASAPAAVKAR
jgi:hypothetical protein